MLIRSQDGKKLLNFGNSTAVEALEIEKADVRIAYSNICETYDLGEYTSIEKGIKVLDMIQEAYAEYKITCTFLTGFTGHRAIVESNNVCVNGFEKLVKDFKKNMVFQMPEDGSVEV